MLKNNFDILRLILAVLVFLGHWNLLTEQNIDLKIFHLETFAVDMFFIVSGFLIFWSFSNDQNNKNFFLKRFFRVFPLYAFVIILQTTFFVYFSNGNLEEIFRYFFSNILFLNFLAPTVGEAFSNFEFNAINGSLWTLKNEIIFYSIVPIIFVLYKKWNIIFLIILFVLSVCYMFIVDYFEFTKLLVQFPAQLRLFIVGVFLYVLFNKIDKLDIKHIYIFVSFSILLMIVFFENKYFKFILYPICISSVVIYLVYYIKLIKINFDFSYSFYILHFPIIQLSLYFGINPSNPILSFLGLFLIILVLSYFSERYIEKKFVAMGRKIVKKDKNATN